MAIPTLSGSYIDQTFHRLVQVTSSGTEFADGLGNPITFGGVTVPGGPINSLQYNKDGTNFTGSANLTFNSALNTLILTGSLIQGLEGNIASGEYSHAEGSATTASGGYSHAEGDFTQAKGNYSHAEGQETIASGSYSHAEGYRTISSANWQHVQGQWNATSSVQSAFIVGNGTDNNNRSNLIHAAGNEVQITGSIVFNEGARITPNYYGNTSYTGYIDIVAGGPDGFVELLSYNQSSSLAVDDFGIYLLTASGSQFLWQFKNNGVLEAPGGIEAPSFTGSLFGTASWATNFVSASNYVLNSQTSSFVRNNQTSSFVQNSQTSSFVTNSQTSSFATTGSNSFKANQTITGSLIVTGSATITGSLNVTQGITGSLQGTASWASNALTASFTPNALTTASVSSNVITFTKGNGSTFALTVNTGSGGGGSISTSGSTLYSTDPAAGPGFNTNNSIFLGSGSGYQATSASYSTLIGYKVGRSFSGNNIDVNNIIIGTNISLPDGTANAINLGGVIFATDTNNNISPDPYIIPANGKVGINVVTPAYTLDVNGSGNFSNSVKNSELYINEASVSPSVNIFNFLNFN